MNSGVLRKALRSEAVDSANVKKSISCFFTMMQNR